MKTIAINLQEQGGVTLRTILTKQNVSQLIMLLTTSCSTTIESSAALKGIVNTHRAGPQPLWATCLLPQKTFPALATTSCHHLHHQLSCSCCPAQAGRKGHVSSTICVLGCRVVGNLPLELYHTEGQILATSISHAKGMSPEGISTKTKP